MNTTPSPISPSLEALPPAERRRLQARARRLARRAETLAGAGRMAEAIACQSEVADLRPNDAIAFLRLGLLLREARQVEPAVQALRRAAALSPTQRDPREALLATLLDGGRYKEIIADALSFLKVAPRSVFARDVLSIAYLQLGQLDNALRTVQELILLDPRCPDHFMKRAMLLHQKGEIRASMRDYERVLAMAPDDSDAYEAAANTLSALDDNTIRQIAMLAGEDRLFAMRLHRDATEAARERGFLLSEEGFARLRFFAASNPDSGSTLPGPPRFYN